MSEEHEALTQNRNHHATEQGNYSSCSQETSSRDRQCSPVSNDLTPGQGAGGISHILLFALGCLSGVIVALAWTVSGSCAQALGGVVPTFELNCARFGGPLLVAIPTILYQRLSINVNRKQALCLLFHGCCFSLSNIGYYEAAKYIPLGMLGGSESSLLIVFLSVLELATVKKCRTPIPVSLVLSISGILFLTQPAFVFKYFGPVKESYTNPVCVVNVDAVMSESNATTVFPGNITDNVTAEPDDLSSTLTDEARGFALITASTIFFAIAIVAQTRYLHELNTSVIVFGMSAVGFGTSALGMLCLETPTIPAEPQCVSLLAGHILSATVGNWSYVVTVSLTSGFMYSLLSHLQLFFFFVAQYTAMKSVNPGYRNWEEIVGAVFVFAAGVFGPSYTLYKQWTLRKETKNGNDELEMED